MEKKAAAKAKAAADGPKAQAPKMTSDEKKRAKVVAAAAKEGGKKGQDLAGMCDIGGMKYFTVSMEQCFGEWELLEAAMAGANKEVDPEGDDRKGGAHELAKCFFSCGEDGADCKILVHMKEELQGDLSIKDWVTTMISDSDVCGEIIEESATTIKAVAKKGAQGKELFPLKQRDAAINASFRMLREKKLVAEQSSGSEVDMGELAAGADFEW
jgi:lysyl-tRNA synthetase class 2